MMGCFPKCKFFQRKKKKGKKGVEMSVQTEPCTEYDVKLGQLTEELASSNRRMVHLQANGQLRNAEYRNISKKLIESESSAMELAESLGKLQLKMTEMECDLEEKTSSLAESEKEKRSLFDDLERKRTLEDEGGSDRQALVLALEGKSALEKINAALQTDLEKARQCVTVLTEKYSTVKTKRDSLKDNLQMATLDLELAAEREDNLRKEIDNERDAHKMVVKGLHCELAQAQQEMLRFEIGTHPFKVAFKHQCEERVRLGKENAELLEENSCKDSILEELRERFKKMEDAHEALRQNCAEVKENCRVLKRTREKLTEDNQRLSAEIEILRTQSESLTAVNRERPMETRVGNKKTSLNGALTLMPTTEKGKLNVRVSHSMIPQLSEGEKNREITRLTVSNDKLTTKIRSLKEKLRTSEQLKNKLEDDLYELREVNRFDEIEKSDLKEQVKERDSELEELREHLAELEAKDRSREKTMARRVADLRMTKQAEHELTEKLLEAQRNIEALEMVRRDLSSQHHQDCLDNQYIKEDLIRFEHEKMEMLEQLEKYEDRLFDMNEQNIEKYKREKALRAKIKNLVESGGSIEELEDEGLKLL